MPYVLPDQRRIAPDAAFVLNDIQYGRGWLRRASQVERDALGITWEAPPAPPPPSAPTKTDVDRARDAYLSDGVIVSVTGYANPIHVQCREKDWRNLNGLAIRANARVADGDTTTMTGFRCATDTNHDLSPPQIAELWALAFAHLEAVYAASWALKALDPIPADYATNPAHWPANGL